MDDLDITAIAEELNAMAPNYEVGRLQEIRTHLKGLSRPPSRSIFSFQTIHEDWAFHLGGRSELQYNIGREEISDVVELRYGVAFSLETSRSLPEIDVLVPKVRLFNEFMRLYPDLYADMRMWYYQVERSGDYMPGPIAPELVTEGVFVFLGKRQHVDQIDFESILSDFDRLLPLYQYVESAGTLQPLLSPTGTGFVFRAGNSHRASSTVATLAQRQLDVILRHNDLQLALYNRLVSLFGAERVGVELPNGAGTCVDVVVCHPDEYWFYEIKTALSPRACIREAVGQLLEYSFWPGSQEAARLIVVGETSIDQDGREYLRRLNERFSIPVYYEQVVL